MIITTIFPIKNLVDLKCKYNLYYVKGLVETSEDFEKNRQRLVRHLQFATKSPCALVKRDGKFCIAQPVGYSNMPNEVNLVRCQVRIEPSGETNELDFGNLKDNEVPLAVKFLTFAISDPLFSNND